MTRALSMAMPDLSPSAQLGSGLVPRGTPIDRDALRRAREAAGLTQHQLAVAVDAAGAGRVGAWEAGRAAPSVLNVARLAQALGVSASVLLSPEEQQRGDLRAVRLSLGLSVAQVADRAGMPRSSYLRWEHGDFVHIPPLAALERVASVLGVPVQRLSQLMEQTRKIDPSP